MKSNRKLEIKDILNKDSIAVFTDASVNNKNVTVCSGAVTVDENFDTKYTDVVLSDATVTRGELMAIKIGIEEGLKTGKSIINLFSDSMVCIKSLREWIFNWEKNGRKFNKLINSSRETVVYSDLLMEIVNIIVKNEHVKINLFHQKGHIGEGNYPYSKIKRLFHTNNGFIIDDKFIDIMKIYNNMVDNYTRNNLNIAPRVGRSFTPHESLMFNIDSDVIQKYKKIANIKIGGDNVEGRHRSNNKRSKFKVRKFGKRQRNNSYTPK